MHFVTRATPMHFTNGKGYKSELRSSKNVLNEVQITPLVIYGFGSGHTHTCPHEVISRNQAHAGLRCTWFTLERLGKLGTRGTRHRAINDRTIGLKKFKTRCDFMTICYRSKLICTCRLNHWYRASKLCTNDQIKSQHTLTEL